MRALCKNCVNAIPLLLLSVGVFWTFYVYTYEFCFLYTKSLSVRIILLVFCIVIFLFLIVSLYSAAFTRMDSVPDQFRVSVNTHTKLAALNSVGKQQLLENICHTNGFVLYTRTESGYIRYCDVCHLIKPDRAHHCSSCGKCVVKMDHHCPWLNNCVGHNNHKLFLLMLFYGFVYSTYCFSTMIFLVLEEIGNFSRKNPKHTQPMIMGFLAMIFTLFCGMFGAYHMMLVFRNETTLESLRSTHFMEPNMSFDLGLCNNVKSVFGDNWLLWLLPIVPKITEYDCTYPVKRQAQLEALV